MELSMGKKKLILTNYLKIRIGLSGKAGMEHILWKCSMVYETMMT